MVQNQWVKGILVSLCIAVGLLAVTGCDKIKAELAGDDDAPALEDSAADTDANTRDEPKAAGDTKPSGDAAQAGDPALRDSAPGDDAAPDNAAADQAEVDEDAQHPPNYHAERPADASTCATLHNDDVNGGKTLAQNTCYLVNGALTVSKGTLTVEPGVTFFMDHKAKLVIRDAGRLQAKGSASKKIWFVGTADEPGYWNGVMFYNTGHGDNLLEHILLRHAGYARDEGHVEASRAGIYTHRNKNVDLTVRDARITDTLGYGISIRSAGAVSIQKTTIDSNEKSLAINIDQIGGLSDNLVFKDNDTPEVLVLNKNVTEDATWPNVGVPYLFHHGNPTLAATVTIQPGATLQFKQDAHFTLNKNGYLSADASDGDPIVFTGVENDLPGYWKGLDVHSRSSKNILNNVTVSYAGSGPINHRVEAAALTLWDGSHMTINRVNFTHSGKFGIYTRGDAVLAGCEELTFTGNEGEDFAGSIANASDCK